MPLGLSLALVKDRAKADLALQRKISRSRAFSRIGIRLCVAREPLEQLSLSLFNAANPLRSLFFTRTIAPVTAAALLIV